MLSIGKFTQIFPIDNKETVHCQQMYGIDNKETAHWQQIFNMIATIFDTLFSSYFVHMFIAIITINKFIK